MQEVKKLGVLSVGKISALIGIFLGLLMGIVLMIATKFAPTAGVPEMPIATLGMSSIIVLPILYGLSYFVVGIIVAVVYNLFAKWVGGVKMDLGKESKK
tara:strand:- start:206 stop:502 length:297 start_codon:yes stop_codon:yes gene_type:complete